MKLRLAKKILATQAKISKWTKCEREFLEPDFHGGYTHHPFVESYGNYSGHQKLLASIRLFKYSTKNKLGNMALNAFYLRPLDAFQVDNNDDLKFEWLIGQHNRKESLTIDDKFFTPPPEDRTKIVYNAQGQVHNFNAIPFPGANDKISFKPEFMDYGEETFISNRVVVEQSTKRPRDRATFKRYQSRDNNTRKVPRHHV